MNTLHDWLNQNQGKGIGLYNFYISVSSCVLLLVLGCNTALRCCDKQKKWIKVVSIVIGVVCLTVGTVLLAMEWYEWGHFDEMGIITRNFTCVSIVVEWLILIISLAVVSDSKTFCKTLSHAFDLCEICFGD